MGEQGTYPFGELWYQNSTTSNWVFTTYERDKESGMATGLDYALARSYSINLGRFQSPDPLEGHVGDPQSWNRYAYVEDDPINLSDPSGQGFWSDLGSFLLGIFDIYAGAIKPPSGVIVNFAQTQDSTDCDASGACFSLQAEIIRAIGVIPGSRGSGPPTLPSSPSRPSPTCGGCSEGSNGGPVGNGAGIGGSGTESQSPGSGGAGADSAGSGGVWTEDSPVPGSRLPNGDIAVGIDIFRNSKQCSTCGNIWKNANQINDPRTIAAWYGASAIAGLTVLNPASESVISIAETEPLPPGWTEEWSMDYRGNWWEPNGEWHWDWANRYHLDHWDFKPWTDWNLPNKVRIFRPW